MNPEAIITRLKTVLEFYSLTLSTFADNIEVQRSSLSHLMSGRNKPSLDFVLKVVDKYPDVDLYWLLNGKGTFPKKQQNSISKENPIELEIKNTTPSLFSEVEEQQEEEIKTPITQSPRIAQNEQEVETVSNKRFSESEKKLIKVVLLYDDGTFEDFNQ